MPAGPLKTIRLHVFYGLQHNGERPGSCQAFEDDNAVVVSLTVSDWHGAKTLIGGFTPSHATVELSRPLGDRVVIDDSANRVRPHWTQTQQAHRGQSRLWLPITVALIIEDENPAPVLPQGYVLAHPVTPRLPG